MLEFRNHAKLQYTWMRYLPNESIVDEFWKHLRAEIIDLISAERIIRSRSSRLYTAGQLRILTSEVLDDQGTPLFEDIAPEIYLASAYARADAEKLRVLGLRNIQASQVLDRLFEDLRKASSRYKDTSTSLLWHNRVASLLCNYINRSSALKDEIRSLKIIPLRKEGLLPQVWTSATQGTVYWADCGGIEIPMVLNLRILAPSVVNVERDTLWSHLGVQWLQPALAVQKTVTRFHHSSLLTRDAVELMYFIFWHTTGTTELFDMHTYVYDIAFVGHHFRRPEAPNLYFPTYSVALTAANLLIGAPTSQAWRHVHWDYVKIFDSLTVRGGRTWQQFLEKAVGITTYPQLLKRDGINLSEEFEFIIKNKPDQLVAVLWRWQDVYLSKFRSCRSELQTAEVSLDNQALAQLQDTIFPTYEVKSSFEAMGITRIPCLAIVPEMRNEGQHRLTFLADLGVSIAVDLSTLLKALEHICTYDAPSHDVPAGLTSLYQKLNEHARESDARIRLKYGLSSFARHL